MRLYNFAFGPYPQRATIYLAEKKLTDIDVVWLQPPGATAGWPPPAVSELTPAGTASLPMLVDDDGTVVNQSLAILDYLEDKHANPDMRGATIAMRARVRQFVSVLDEALTFFGLWARHGSDLGRGSSRFSQDVADICSTRYFDQLRLVERMMSSTAWIAIDDVTIADCIAMAMVQYAAGFYGVPIPADCEKLSKWYDSFSVRPSATAPDHPADKQEKATGLMVRTGINP